jgi:hypothetical protein
MCGLLYFSNPFAPLWLELPRGSRAQTLPFTRVRTIGGVGDESLMCLCPQVRGFLDQKSSQWARVFIVSFECLLACTFQRQAHRKFG